MPTHKTKCSIEIEWTVEREESNFELDPATINAAISSFLQGHLTDQDVESSFDEHMRDSPFDALDKYDRFRITDAKVGCSGDGHTAASIATHLKALEEGQRKEREAFRMAHPESRRQHGHLKREALGVKRKPGLFGRLFGGS